MDCRDEHQPGLPPVEWPEVNMDDFLDIEMYLNDSDTSLFVPNQQACQEEVSLSGLHDNDEPTPRDSGSQYTQNSFSTPSEQSWASYGTQELITEAGSVPFSFDEEVFSLPDWSLGCEPQGINFDVFSDYSPSISSIASIIPSELSSDIPSCTLHEMAGQQIEARAQPESSPAFSAPTTQIKKRRSEDKLRKYQRKVEKPETCRLCGKGHTWKRELNRHMVTTHRREAERMGLDISKTKCKFCDLEVDTIRKDRLRKHVLKKHPGETRL